MVGLVSYLADGGLLQSPAVAPSTEPVEYPFAVDRTLVNLSGMATGPTLDGQTITLDVLVDGVETALSVDITALDTPFTVVGTVAVLAGQVVSLRATSSGEISADVGLTATVGVQ